MADLPGPTVDSIEAAAALEAVESPVDAWLDVDVGYGRTGIPWEDRDALARVLGAVLRSGRHRPRGVLTHAGHAYHVAEVAARLALWTEIIERMAAARDALVGPGATPALEISVGDTPTAGVIASFDGVDEARPGNFVLGDLQQHALSSSSSGDLALVVACPVVGVYPHRGERHSGRRCPPIARRCVGSHVVSPATASWLSLDWTRGTSSTLSKPRFAGSRRSTA